jgi:hypothetical protein
MIGFTCEKWRCQRDRKENGEVSEELDSEWRANIYLSKLET